MGIIALVTLIRSSNDETVQAGELIEQIRKAILSTEISKGWAIEKISILGSKIDSEIASKMLGEAELVAAGLSPASEEKTS